MHTIFSIENIPRSLAQSRRQGRRPTLNEAMEKVTPRGLLVAHYIMNRPNLKGIVMPQTYEFQTFKTMYYDNIPRLKRSKARYTKTPHASYNHVHV